MIRRSRREPRTRPPPWLSNPPVGTLFLIVEGDHEGEVQVRGNVLVRLPGFREDVGSLRFRFIPDSAPRDHFPEYPSVSFLSKCRVIQFNNLRRQVAKVVAHLLQDPPLDGLIVRTRDLVVMPEPVECGGVHHGMPLGSLTTFSRSLRDVLHDNLLQPAISLDHRHYMCPLIQGGGVATQRVSTRQPIALSVPRPGLV